MSHFTRLMKKGRRRLPSGQFVRISIAALALGLGGCSYVPNFDSRATGYARGFNGAVAGDEPQAVLVARDILAAGGSAADAVTAAYFTMSVTLPSAASLGAGGICIVHDKAKASAEALDFTHPGSGPHAGSVAPIAPRAMQALHSKYGHVPWTQVVGPAESLARLGQPASRAFARALAAAPHVLGDPAMAKIFADKSGNLVTEGVRINQFALAGTLSQIRRQPNQVYTGPFVRRLAADFTAAGVPITVADLRAVLPRFRPVVTVTYGDQVAHFPPTPAGIVTAQAWAILYGERTFTDASAAERPLLLANVSREVYADAGRWFAAPDGVPDSGDIFVTRDRIRRLMDGLKRPAAVPSTSPFIEPVDMGSASVIALDIYGQSVACGFTMNGILGAGRMAPETGIVIAAPSNPAARSAAALGQMIVRSGTAHQVEFVGAATGGAMVPMALATGAVKVLETKETAETILDAPRLYNPAHPDRVVIEDRPDARTVADALRRAGRTVVTAPSLGRANIVICPRGFEADRSLCEVRADRRAFGLAQQN